MRFFNTAGPCRPEKHFMLPAAARLPEARLLVDREHYFVVHAPRQTGKTTTLKALAWALTAEGRYVALHLTCEEASAVGDGVVAAERIILHSLRLAAQAAGLAPELAPPDPWPEAPEGQQLRTALAEWAQRCPRPVVLFLDEVDSLAWPSLVSVLRQLRAGYNARPAPFPHSVVLCGMRDLKDYREASREASPEQTALRRTEGPSPFNIKVESLRLGDFTADEVEQLYAQHTTETGQQFTGEAVTKAFEYTQGQPWLVNALAAEIVDKMQVSPSTPIDEGHVERAKERLILTRATHLDSLAARLAEPRVKRVIEPLIAGELAAAEPSFHDDVAYAQDLGLLAQGKLIQVANPIYREVIVRVLGDHVERRMVTDPQSFVQPDGRLDFRMLLEQFVAFWGQNAEVLTKSSIYHEVAPQLVIMAFIHRIVNGGGAISREFGLGYGRIDLLIRWPYKDPHRRQRWQQEAVELKVWHPDRPDPTDEALTQLDEYLDRLRLDHGTLVVFDRRPPGPELPPLPRRISFTDTQTPSGRPVTFLRA